MAGVVYLIQFGATWFMTGLIWFVQVVHYPLFDQVGESGYRSYQEAHMRRTSWVVAPVMCIEAASAIAALWLRPPIVAVSLAWTGLALLALIWVSTWLLQVPAHGKLSEGFDRRAHERLVGGNWWRTVLWSARAVLLTLPFVQSCLP